MARLKVLQLENWQRRNPGSSATATMVTPVFYRDGQYLYKDVCWFEVAGFAWTLDKDSFQYQLETLNQRLPTSKELELISSITQINKDLLSPAATKMLTAMEMHSLLRDMKLTVFKIKKGVI